MKKNIIIASAMLFAGITLIANAETKAPPERGQFCGGIGAIRCAAGFTCKLDGTYPDAGGICIKADRALPDGISGSRSPAGEARRASSTEERVSEQAKEAARRLANARREVAKVVAHLGAAADRVQKLSDRVSSHLDKLAAAGRDVTVSRKYLADAKIKLDESRTKILALKTAAEAAFTAQTPKKPGIMKNIEVLAKDAAKTIDGAHRLVAKSISNIKPGLNVERSATSIATSTN